MNLRATAGFLSDQAFVEETYRDPSAFPNIDYGIPLSVSEAAEIEERIKIQLAVDPVVEQVTDAPGFGGLWMDQAAGGVPVFQVTSVDSPIVEIVRASLDGITSPRFEVVERSRADLVVLKDRVWSDRAAMEREGIYVQSVALDIRHNRVEVGVVGLTTVEADAIEQRYAGVVTVEEAYDEQMDACNGVNDCYPMKGGLRIKVVGSPEKQCTSGFNVRLAGTSTFRVLTAGHCLSLAPGGVGDAWMHHGTQFGTGRVSTWATLANADAGLISTSEPSGPDNLMFGVWEEDIRTVVGYTSAEAQNVDDFVCRQGEESGLWCGYILNEDQNKFVDGKEIEHQWVVDFDANPGDSGGPYFLTSNGLTYAWGIHSDSTDASPPAGKAWYSPMSRVLSVLANADHPIVLCTSATCGL